jgi:hypothetical protein
LDLSDHAAHFAIALGEMDREMNLVRHSGDQVLQAFVVQQQTVGSE